MPHPSIALLGGVTEGEVQDVKMPRLFHSVEHADSSRHASLRLFGTHFRPDVPFLSGQVRLRFANAVGRLLIKPNNVPNFSGAQEDMHAGSAT